jgi:MoaA/NifB/PqqE/SkfB family radical SAM enzyme
MNLRANKFLDLDVLTNCDQRCIFCGGNYLYLTTKQQKRKKQQLSAQEILDNFRQNKNILLANKDKYAGVNFIGDDCTRSRYLVELIALAKKLKYPIIKIISPGSIGNNRRKMQQLISAGLTQSVFTLNGYNAKTHDEITLRRGSFSRLIKAIKFFKSQQIYIEINIPLIKQTLPNITQIIQLGRQLKVDHINLFVWYPNERHRQHTYLIKPDLQAIINALKQIKNGFYSISNLPLCLNPNREIFEVYFSGLDNSVLKYFDKIGSCQDCQLNCPGIYDLDK